MKLLDEFDIFKTFNAQFVKQLSLKFKQCRLSKRCRLGVILPNFLLLMQRPIKRHRYAFFALNEKVDVFDKVVLSWVYCALGSWIFDFRLDSIKIGVNLVGLFFTVLALIYHYCKIKIQRETRKLVEIAINKLKYFHITDVELLRD